ncbi:MAG: TIGR03619 family F420-dependent LLM class oxidoreductase [Acidimicrobiales bacterium]
MQLSLGLSNFGSFLPPDQWHRFPDLGRMAEDAGIDRLVVVDHVVMGANTDAYRWGRFPTAPEAPWLEPLTMLAGLAASTSTVRLATGVIIPALRGAPLLAKTAATLDVMSQGRLELGVGLGWQREEYEASGLDWSRRGALLTDTLGACRALWSDWPATYRSDTVQFTDIWCSPRPVQAGGVPFWIAGTLSAANLDRLVRFGQGWIPIMGESVDGLAAGVAQVRQALADAGRDPAELGVQGALAVVRDADKRADLAATVDGARALADAGATAAHAGLQAFCTGIDDAARVMADLGRRFAELGI